MKEFTLPEVEEPSGICFHDARETLFVADDTGVVCELRTDGSVVRQRRVRKADVEGITHDPASGLLYLAIEGDDTILEVHPDSLEPIREFTLPRIYLGRTVLKEGGSGIEGITFVPDQDHPQGGTFFVANQSDKRKATSKELSAVFEVEVPLREQTGPKATAKILRLFRPGVVDLSGLHYDAKADRLIVISDDENRILAFSRTGDLLGTWALPGQDQEGVAIDADGVLYIAQDSGGVRRARLAGDPPGTPKEP